MLNRGEPILVCDILILSQLKLIHSNHIGTGGCSHTLPPPHKKLHGHITKKGQETQVPMFFIKPAGLKQRGGGFRNTRTNLDLCQGNSELLGGLWWPKNGISSIKLRAKALENPGIPTTIKTMGVNITTIVYLRVLIIQIGSTIILMVVEAQGKYTP